MAPGWAAASAKMCSLYSAVKVRRLAAATTSGSGRAGLGGWGALHRLIKTELETAQPALRAACGIATENYSFSLEGMGEQNAGGDSLLREYRKVASSRELRNVARTCFAAGCGAENGTSHPEVR